MSDPRDPTPDVDWSGLAAEAYCYLTTTGRQSGRPHTVEIWFALHGSTAYLLSGGGERADWVRNLRREPDVAVRIGDRHFAGRARLVTDAEEDGLARELLPEKYQRSYRGDLSGWRGRALPVAIELTPAAS